MEGPEIQFAEAVIDNGSLRHPHRPVRDRPPRPPGRRLRRRLPRRGHDAAVGHHGRQAPQGPVRLLPPHGRRRGADVRRRAHPRLVLPPRGPPAAPRRSSPAGSSTGRCARRSSRACATRSRSSSPSSRSTRTTLRRPRHQRRLDVHAAVGSALHRPDRRRARRAHRRPVGRLPAALRAGARRLRDGRGRPRGRGRRRRDHDGRGRGHRRAPGTSSRTRASRAPPRRSSPPASRPAKPFIQALCDAQSELAAEAAKPTAELPALPRLPAGRLRRRRRPSCSTT